MTHDGNYNNNNFVSYVLKIYKTFKFYKDMNAVYAGWEKHKLVYRVGRFLWPR